jgi:predicted transcriptional regulator
MADPRLSGRDLKAERVRAGLTQTDLSAVLGVNRSRIAAVEGQIRVSPRFAERVFRALKDEAGQTVSSDRAGAEGA